MWAMLIRTMEQRAVEEAKRRVVRSGQVIDIGGDKWALEVRDGVETLIPLESAGSPKAPGQNAIPLKGV